MVRNDFIAVAATAAALLRSPEVAASWDKPSALAEFSVRGLAGHLAYQVLVLPSVLATPEPLEETVTLLEHYARVEWIGAPIDTPFNVRIREGGEELAVDGPAALGSRVDAVLAEVNLEQDRPVRLPIWGPWSLRLEDLLVTRMMELVVHCDDLAVSVGVSTPEFPETAVETVVDLLSRLAVRRHGATNVLRALSRAERSPSTIAAF